MQIQKSISSADIEKIVLELAKLPQTEIPLEHHFAPGVYMRVVEMPADTFVVGQLHKTEHLNIVLTGRATVYCEGITKEIIAPFIFKSGIDAQKILYIHEAVRWATIHPTHETDLKVLEEMLITKSAALLEYEQTKLLAQGDES